MPSVDKVISKLFKECVDNNEDENIDPSTDVQDILRYCEKHERLTEHNGNYFAFVKTSSNDFPAVRIICAIKQGKKKVFNVEKIMKLVREIEKSLIFIDSTHTKKQDNFFYLDMIKELPKGAN